MKRMGVHESAWGPIITSIDDESSPSDPPPPPDPEVCQGQDSFS